MNSIATAFTDISYKILKIRKTFSQNFDDNCPHRTGGIQLYRVSEIYSDLKLTEEQPVNQSGFAFYWFG